MRRFIKMHRTSSMIGQYSMIFHHLECISQTHHPPTAFRPAHWRMLRRTPRRNLMRLTLRFLFDYSLLVHPAF
jgi:hypothetical protein